MPEGYTKFEGTWIFSELGGDISKLNEWRNKFYKLKLIGMYENGIGYGNISSREEKGFIISGTKTGGIEYLTKKHYTKVIDWSFSNNFLTSVGPIAASSESLTHAAVYEASPETKAVIHIHSLEFWERLKDKIPTTDEKVEYGTPEMAEEILKLFQKTDIKEKKILVMAGHKEGIISFGNNLDEAGNILLRYLSKV
jgi:L-ribulose-5-phosphate 4-epimerase